jgi:RimJ/RimL family protein N-acetyltransferase
VRRILETERLIVREFVEDDAEAFFAFNGDPEVMRFTGEEPIAGVEAAREALRSYPDYRERGYGRWAVVRKDDDRVIGFNGLKYLADLDEVDLGYRFRVDCWGRGYATESSRAILDHGFATLGLTRIIGLALPANLASIRVLEKVGMRFEGLCDYEGQRAQRWAIERGR